MTSSNLLGPEIQKLLESVKIQKGMTMDIDTENKILGILSVVARRRHPPTTFSNERCELNTAMVKELKIYFTYFMEKRGIEIPEIIRTYYGEPFGDFASYTDESHVISILREDFLIDTGDILAEWHSRWKYIDEDELENEFGDDDNEDLAPLSLTQTTKKFDRELTMLDILRCMSSRTYPSNISKYERDTLTVLMIEGLKHKFIKYAKKNNILIANSVVSFQNESFPNEISYEEEYYSINILRDIFNITIINGIELENECKIRWTIIKNSLINEEKLRREEFNKKLLKAKKEGIPKNKGRLVCSDKIISVSPIVHMPPIQ
jgi:hypothetical protein